jgi:putative membrane protein
VKTLFRHFLIDTFAIYIASRVAHGMVFGESYKTLILAGIAMAGVSFLAKPVINILLLPINLVTFGLFRWVSSALVLYIITLLIDDFRITSFIFDGLESAWISIPMIHLTGIFSYIGFSFIISVVTSFFYWLIK